MSQAAIALAKKLKAERVAREAEQARLAKIEVDKLAAEAEQARLSKIETDRLAAEAEQARLAKIEADRLAAEAEQARLAKIETDKLAAEAEQDRLAKIETDRLAAEAEQVRLAKIETDRLAAEAEQARLAKVETDRLAAEAEQVRLAKIETDRLAAEAEQARLVKLEQESLEEVLSEFKEEDPRQSNDTYNVFVHAAPTQKLIAGPVTNSKSSQLAIIKRKADEICLASNHIDTMNKFIVVYQENDREHPICSADFCISPMQQQIIVWQAEVGICIAPPQPLSLVIWGSADNNSSQICEMNVQAVSSFYPSSFPLSLLGNNSAQVYMIANPVMLTWQAPLISVLGDSLAFMTPYYLDFPENQNVSLVNNQYPQEELITVREVVEFVGTPNLVSTLEQSDISFVNLTQSTNSAFIGEPRLEQKTSDDLKLKIDQAKAICTSKVAVVKTEMCETRSKEVVYFSCKENFSNPKEFVDCIVKMHNSHLSYCNDLLDLCGEIFTPFSESEKDSY